MKSGKRSEKVIAACELKNYYSSSTKAERCRTKLKDWIGLDGVVSRPVTGKLIGCSWWKIFEKLPIFPSVSAHLCLPL